MSEEFPGPFNDQAADSENSDLLFQEEAQPDFFQSQQAHFPPFDQADAYRPPQPGFEEATMPGMMPPQAAPAAPAMPPPEAQVNSHMLHQAAAPAAHVPAPTAYPAESELAIPAAPVAYHEESKDNYELILNPSQPHKQASKHEIYKMISDKIKSGDISQAIEMMDAQNIDPRNYKFENFNHNPLFFSAVIKDPVKCLEAFKTFLDRGVDITYEDVLKQTVLFYLAREGHIDCIQLAVENGCNVNQIDQYKQSPLYYSAREGRLEATQRLIKLGANIEAEDHAEQSPLFYASKNGHAEIVELFCQMGANPNKKDKRKTTSLQYAKRNGHEKVVEVLLKYGAEMLDDPQDKKRAQQKKSGNRNKKKTNVDKVSTKKYILHRQKENGEWEPYPEEEWEAFKASCPEVAQYLENPSRLAELDIPDIPDGVPLFDSWEKAAKKIMTSLWKVQGARIFHEPVDPEALQIPDYPDIVKNPMDFGTIKKKLNGYSYRSGQEFLDDVALVFSNCILYNGANSEVGMITKNIEEEFNNQLDSLNFNYYLF